MLTLNGNERVLVCPLGWGLGHATRVIPIISNLLSRGCQVIIAGDVQSINLLKTHFPEIEYILFPSLSIKLSKGNNQTLALLKIAVRLVLSIKKENRALQRILKDNRIDIVISDNRYGLYSSTITTVLITHQLRVIFPKPFKWAQPIGERFVRQYTERFTQCWIPDNPNGLRLSGELTQPKVMPNNPEFIGLLSRFNGKDCKPSSTKWDLLGIVSGPPPHRELFEMELVKLSNRLGLKSLIIQGLPSNESTTSIQGLATVINHLGDKEMAEAVLSSKYIICRSGYSTLMDLIALNKTALLVPTPGQTEQEYLAKHLKEQNMFEFVNQDELKRVDTSLLSNSSKIFRHTPKTFFA